MIVGVSMVRDELDILPYTLRRMMRQLDHLIISDNRSIDGTREWLAEFAADNAVTVLHDDDPAYFQSEKMTHLAYLAKDMGADWVIPFDADEVWVGLEHLQEVDATVVQVHLYNHVPTDLDERGGEIIGALLHDPWVRINYLRPKPGPLPKVCFRPLTGFVLDQGNHSVHFPGPVDPTFMNEMHIRHMPYRTPEQMIRKALNGAEAYAAAGDSLPYSMGQHWRDYANLVESQGEDALIEVFYTWFFSRDPDNEGLVFSPCPI